MYGAAKDEFNTNFLRELVNIAKDNPYPILIGGDFNILRYRQEKNNDHFDNYQPFLFNVVIDSLKLREISMSGRQFTWANNRPVPTYEKLDRVLMDTEWEAKYPMVSVHALEHIEKLSNHATPHYSWTLVLICFAGNNTNLNSNWDGYTVTALQKL